MNKITKYLTTGAAALLMLMSVGAAQNSVNASRKHYRNHVTRKVRVRRHRSRRTVNSRKNNKRSVKRNWKNRRNHRVIKREINQLKRRVKKNRRIRRNRRRKQVILKPRYRVAQDNRKGNRALRKTGFYDGKILSEMNYSKDFAHYVFSKYAPNDKRSLIPNFMNPKASKQDRKLASYSNINHYSWVKGNFSLSHPWNNTKNPQVYKYYPKAHGWELAPRY